MSRPVTVVDYGIGNLYSVTRALEVCGASVRLTANHEHIEDAERVVLPGVGAFADGMKGLTQRAQSDPIRRFIASGRPFLGKYLLCFCQYKFDFSRRTSWDSVARALQSVQS